jgi:predicted RNA-binding protein YlqC (UPF0109 family)
LPDPSSDTVVVGRIGRPHGVRGEVTVDLLTNRRGKTLEIRVHPDDLGKVIGRGGRTAKALRQVMTGVGGRGLRVDVVDTDGR